MNKMDISIIIPTKNGESDIGECLKGIFQQTTDLEYEVIVIDSGSCDRTVNIIREFPVQLIQIKPEEFGHGKTRNLGARYAKGKYLVYLTQDAYPADKLWLSSLIANFTDEKVAGVYSRWIPKPDCNPLELRRIIEDFSPLKEIRDRAGVEQEDYERHLKRFIHFSDVSSALSREIWEKIPFDDDALFAEDGQWAREVLEAGYSIIYEPKSRVYHSHNHSLRTIMKRGFDGAHFLSHTSKITLNPLRLLGVFLFLTALDWHFLIMNKLSLSQKIKWSIYAIARNFLGQLAIIAGFLKQYEYFRVKGDR